MMSHKFKTITLTLTRFLLFLVVTKSVTVVEVTCSTSESITVTESESSTITPEPATTTTGTFSTVPSTSSSTEDTTVTESEPSTSTPEPEMTGTTSTSAGAHSSHPENCSETSTLSETTQTTVNTTEPATPSLPDSFMKRIIVGATGGLVIISLICILLLVSKRLKSRRQENVTQQDRCKLSQELSAPEQLDSEWHDFHEYSNISPKDCEPENVLSVPEPTAMEQNYPLMPTMHGSHRSPILAPDLNASPVPAAEITTKNESLLKHVKERQVLPKKSNTPQSSESELSFSPESKQSHNPEIGRRRDPDTKKIPKTGIDRSLDLLDGEKVLNGKGDLDSLNDRFGYDGSNNTFCDMYAEPYHVPFYTTASLSTFVTEATAELLVEPYACSGFLSSSHEQYNPVTRFQNDVKHCPEENDFRSPSNPSVCEEQMYALVNKPRTHVSITRVCEKDDHQLVMLHNDLYESSDVIQSQTQT